MCQVIASLDRHLACFDRFHEAGVLREILVDALFSQRISSPSILGRKPDGSACFSGVRRTSIISVYPNRGQSPSH